MKIFGGFDYTKEHYIKLILVSIVIALLVLSIVFLPRNQTIDNGIIVQQSIIIFGITLDNWFTWISIIGLVSTAIWAIYQFNKSRLIKQQEKASEIAANFSENLVEKISIISTVLMKNKSISSMLNKILNSKLEDFTVMEITKILKNKDCFELFDKNLRSEETQQLYSDTLKRLYNDKEQEKFNSNFPLLVENTLNELEAICISIGSKAAGSQFIYNSLHQCFLQLIEILAVKISANNNNNVDKYFTNIIQVYNMWNRQKTKDIEKYNKTRKKINDLKAQMDKEVEKLLKKKNKTI